jgi:hypothetical protein
LTVRGIILLAVLLVPAALEAQTPQPGTATGGQGQVFTPAPVPGVVPGAPINGGPSAVPEQLVSPSAISGPPNATPFSSTPSSNLPSDNAMSSNPDGPAGRGGSLVPNLSK